MTLDDRLAAPLQAKPGDVQPEHGQHELQHLPRWRPGENLEARLGEAVSGSHRRPHLPQHVPRHRRHRRTLGKAHGTRFECECYDVGHLYNLAYCLDQKIVEPPLFVQTIFGILGGIGADPRNLLFMKETADRLFGDGYVWSVLAAGRHQMAFTTMAGILGGNVRVGLEDSLYIGRGALAKRTPNRCQDSPHPGGAQPRNRHAEGGARDFQTEGWRPRGVLAAQRWARRLTWAPPLPHHADICKPPGS